MYMHINKMAENTENPTTSERIDFADLNFNPFSTHENAFLNNDSDPYSMSKFSTGIILKA